jgi:hypothetical protein
MVSPELLNGIRIISGDADAEILDAVLGVPEKKSQLILVRVRRADNLPRVIDVDRIRPPVWLLAERAEIGDRVLDRRRCPRRRDEQQQEWGRSPKG